MAVVMSTFLLIQGCQRVETGEVGLRVNSSKEIESKELLPGSWNQTIVGSIIEFPVRDIVVNLVDKKYQVQDNATLDDFDLTFVYSVEPSQVSELYSTRSKAFHGINVANGDVYLMQVYMETIVNNAAYKAVRKYGSLEIGDKRQQIEEDILLFVSETLKKDKLDVALKPVSVAVKSIMPNQQIRQSATDLVKKQNEEKIKDTEIRIAEKEAQRMKALSENSKASIEYLDAQTRNLIAQGIANGKNQIIVVPTDFKGIVNAK